MSYEITITGGEILTLDDVQGEKIKQLKLTGRPSDIIEVGNDVLELSRIRQIKQVPDRKPKVPLHMLPQGTDRCKGKRSIQKEIMMIIRKKYPKDWPKYFRDKEYKEKLRVWLHENRKGEWCDASINTCVCTTDWEPDPEEVRAAIGMFPGAVAVDVPDEVREDLK